MILTKNMLHRRFSAVLEHWPGESFRAKFFDPQIPNGFLTFERDDSGKVSGIKLDFPPLLDVDFSELEIRRKNESVFRSLVTAY